MKRNKDATGAIVERHLGSLEAQIMRLLWKKSNLTVRDVVESLPRSQERAYTTIMTVMNRLYEKGLLLRVIEGRAYAYSPRMSEQEFLDDVTRRTVRKLIADFGDAAVAGFVGEMRERGPQDLERLRRLVEEGTETDAT